MSMDTQASLVPVEEIGKRIFLIRGRRVMLDADLAAIYSVSTRRLNEQVRRNRRRFPRDFMFRLTRSESVNLMSQIATSSSGWGGRRKLPLAFTQEGVAMLSGVLHSRRAIRVNIAIMRAFVRLREMISAHRDLAERLDKLEKESLAHGENIRSLFQTIQDLTAVPDPPRPAIGFKPDP